MESDVIPIRPGWLDAAYDQPLVGKWLPFWVKGSPGYRWCPALQSVGSCKPIDNFVYREDLIKGGWEPIYVHINGNALYNIGDARFRKFLLDYRMKEEASERKLEFFDTSIYKEMYSSRKMTWLYVMHLYQYSEFIINIRDSAQAVYDNLEMFPNAFLLHTHHDVNATHINKIPSREKISLDT
jgi:hypothetical protein